MWVHGGERTEIAVQVPRDELAKRRIVSWKADDGAGDAMRPERASEQIELRSFSRPVDSFDGDEFAANSHEPSRQAAVIRPEASLA